MIGDLYYELAFANADEVPFPSLADGFYLLLYPLVYAGLALLLYSRLEDIRTDLWVDGVIAALAIAAVGAALFFDVIVETTGTESEVDALITVLRGYGIKEMVRTGAVVMSRGAQSIEEATKR